MGRNLLSSNSGTSAESLQTAAHYGFVSSQNGRKVAAPRRDEFFLASNSVCSSERLQIAADHGCDSSPDGRKVVLRPMGFPPTSDTTNYSAENAQRLPTPPTDDSPE